MKNAMYFLSKNTENTQNRIFQKKNINLKSYEYSVKSNARSLEENSSDS